MGKFDGALIWRSGINTKGGRRKITVRIPDKHIRNHTINSSFKNT